MRDYTWWLGRKHRVRKKYTLFLGRYMSPKEVKLWLKDWRARKKVWIAERRADEHNTERD